MSETLLELRGLKTWFMRRGAEPVRAVDGVSFALQAERTLGIVGESGCGKSVTGLSIMGLLPMPPARIAAGEIRFRRPGGGIVDLARLPPKGRQFRAIRGAEIGMIFQEPMTSLDPVYTIGDQIAETVRAHRRLGRAEAAELVLDMLNEVGLPAPAQRAGEYPFQLSGGMRQRVMIAMALACRPALVIADEPTTALDVTVQAQILDLLNELRAQHRTATLLISHDLGVIAAMADHVAVMYLGRVVEAAPVRELFRHPAHPYTQGLFHSLPSLVGPRRKLTPIQGTVPSPTDLPPGCGFAARCAHATDRCRAEAPPDIAIGGDHTAACWLHA